MLVFLGVRLYTKCYILKRFTADDCTSACLKYAERVWLMSMSVTCALAALGAVIYYIDCCLCVTGGGRFGRHLWDITAADITALASLIVCHQTRRCYHMHIMLTESIAGLVCQLVHWNSVPVGQINLPHSLPSNLQTYEVASNLHLRRRGGLYDVLHGNHNCTACHDDTETRRELAIGLSEPKIHSSA